MISLNNKKNMYILNKKGFILFTTEAASKVTAPIFASLSVVFLYISNIYCMNRISKNKSKIMMAMEPRMRRLMERIKQDETTEYFLLTDEEKDVVAHQIASTTLTTTISLLNNYTREELPDLFDISIINLTSLEEQFVELEMYSQAQMMRDAITILTNDLFELAKPKL